MHSPRILDTGPCLNFLASNNEKVLIGVVQHLHLPETVIRELENRAKKEPNRFGQATSVLNKMKPNFVTELSDDISDSTDSNFVRALARISRLPAAEALSQPRDVGELTVIAHAVALAEEGHDVIVVIDEINGRRVAKTEVGRLARLKLTGTPVGQIRILSTTKILDIAFKKGLIPDKNSLRQIYEQLRALDDGLIHIDETTLLR